MFRKFRTARRRIISGGVLVLLMGSLFSSPVLAQRKTAHTRRKPATTAPAKARAINVEELKALLKRDRNRPLLVNWWATWCNPCREEFPELVKIDGDYRAKGLDFIAISLDDLADLKTAVPQFIREMKATMPIYLLNVQDPDPVINYVDGKWGGDLPATFLYNNNGEVVYKHFGRINTPELRAAIEKLLGNKQ
ncbi:MAG TPA: redoxin domain-containing protein [Pyrinomonadaceae bacterium]|nr:redoxin domain-containing protein [Pyrinomonadaceae bacterium]